MLFILLLKLLQLRHWSSVSLFLHPFEIAHQTSFLKHFLSFQYYKYGPSSSCVFPAPALELPISPWFLLLEKGIRNHDMDFECVHCCWSVIDSRPSQPTELRCILNAY